MLRAGGVDVVFGIIDGTYFGFYRSLPEEGRRDTFKTMHEEPAG